MNKNIPLPLLFAKPSHDQVRMSPLGTYLGWRGRDASTGVLNLWIQKTGRTRKIVTTESTVLKSSKKNSSPSSGSSSPPPPSPPPLTMETPRQITFEADRDCCFLFFFTNDDRYLVYLRETRHGNELYHLYAIDLENDLEEDGIIDSKKKKARDLIGDPQTTCAVGFVGGVQIWTDPSHPRRIYTSTSRGGGFRSLFWDISVIHLDNPDPSKSRIVVEENPLSTIFGILCFFISSVICIMVRWITGGLICFDPPRTPIQWFPDRFMRFNGRIEVSLVELSATWSVRSPPSNGGGNDTMTKPWSRTKWKTLHQVQWEHVNMQLVGSAGGTGTAHMDWSHDFRYVHVHLCHLNAHPNDNNKDLTCDTTTYERFNFATGEYVGRVAGGGGGGEGGEECGNSSNDVKSDITGFVHHPVTREVQCVMYEYEKPTVRCIAKNPTFTAAGKGSEGGLSDNDMTSDLEFLRDAFDNSMSFFIVSRTLDDATWVLYAEADGGRDVCNGAPCGYFLYNRIQMLQGQVRGHSPIHIKSLPLEMSCPSLRMIFSPRPGLAEYELGVMKPIHITARDGEDLLCYLTIAPEHRTEEEGEEQKDRNKTRRALVVLVHGGPQARDSWGFNPLCQLLCARGMNVLQVNYRGSTGMGNKFAQRGMNGAFASTLQHDITDATLHTIASGWAHRDRIAIVGASFGGYCALWAMTFSPGLYRCAAAICPLSIVGAAGDKKSKKAFHGSPLIARYWNRVYGKDVSTNRAIAEAASPLYHVKNICGPILMIHGENDPRVPRDHSDRFAKEMHARGIAGVDYITFAEEGHGIKKERNLLYMYHRMECFLCKNLHLSTPPGLEVRWIHGNTATVHLEDSKVISEECSN